MTTYSEIILASSPYGFWRINESAGAVSVIDSTPNGYNGTPANVTFGALTGPDSNPAASFNGSNSYINVLSSVASFDGDEGSVMMWVKINAAALTDGNNHAALYIEADAANYVLVRKDTVNNQYRFQYAAGGVVEAIITSKTDTDWVCIAITWSKSGDTFKAYWNGALVSTRSTLGNWVGVPAVMLVGAASVGGSQVWSGGEALVALWDRALGPGAVEYLSAIPTTSATIRHIPHNLYEIRIYNHDHALQLILDKWHKLEYHQRINAPWNHQITIELGYDDPFIDTLRSIQDDWIVEVFRIDPVTLVKSKVYEGLHSTTVDQVRVNGGIILNLYGVGYTQFLSRRIVLPPTGLEYATKTGLAETVIKSYVSDCMVSPTDTDRIIPGLSIAADSLAGNTITYSARYTNLDSVCSTVSEQGGLDYGIYGGEEVGEFIFDARGIWGSDLREENPDGNLPAIFSIERDNMLIPILSQNYSAEQNFTYVGGENQGADRVIQEVYDNTAVTRTPYSRKEAFVEARQQADVSSLVAVGLAELWSRRAKQSLSFSVKQTDQLRWIRDWNLGDLITAKYYELSFNKQIAQIGVTVSQSNSSLEDISVTFEDIRNE